MWLTAADVIDGTGGRLRAPTVGFTRSTDVRHLGLSGLRT
jgi:hypothetical protein